VPFKIIAHRGASADAPDNSPAAFRLAIAQRADLIETDVQRTEDGVLVLEHDFEVGSRLVPASRLNELRSLKPELLTVAAALYEFGSQIPFCWEVKQPGPETALVTLIQDLVPAVTWQRTEFTSFFFGSAVHLRELAPANQVGWLTRDWDEAAIKQVMAAGLSQICPPAARVIAEPGLVEVARLAGLEVRVWRVTGPEIVPALAAAGVYGGTVNWPAQARAALMQQA
jgi:glycerophosphoryl diester phosphodiesterase